jgi:DNA recombination protein RmuC
MYQAQTTGSGLHFLKQAAPHRGNPIAWGATKCRYRRLKEHAYFAKNISKNIPLMDPLLLLLCALVSLAIVLIILFRPRQNGDVASLNARFDALADRLDKLTESLRTDLRDNRGEMAAAARDSRTELALSIQGLRTELTHTLGLITEGNRTAMAGIHNTLEEKIDLLLDRIAQTGRDSRTELAQSLRLFGTEQNARLEAFTIMQQEAADRTLFGLERITQKVEDKLTAVNEQARADAHLMRQTLETSFKGFNHTFTDGVDRMNNLQREKFEALQREQQDLVQHTGQKLEHIRETVEEKLQKTLHERLGHSFEQVGRQLESVQKGLGEMQLLAQDVGGLKKVLSNVKMRGGFGEVQLEMLLENILAPEQYAANVATKVGSADRVEFAIRFPNKDGDRNYVWLPIDAKFPKDAYEQLQDAYDGGDHAQIEAAQKALESVIKKMAKDICEKYIDTPNTTNFGILFLPFEGLFAEVVRKASLLEEVQRTCNVVITGPTTLAVILNSLQMGFRTLAIQKRSGEVWTVLAGVKKEFEQFGGLLEKAQSNIQKGLNDLEGVVGVRTRAIQRKLRGVEVLPEAGDDMLVDEKIE